MIILYFHKTYYPDPAMAIPGRDNRAPGASGAAVGRDRTKEDMTPSNPLTDNMIGWVPMSLRTSLLGNMIPESAELSSGPACTTANAGPTPHPRETLTALGPTLGDVRVDG